MEERKLIKIEKDAATTGGRLQSLKLPRDLSLGLKRKKQFIHRPNINVVRNKDKSKEFLKKVEHKGKKERSTGPRIKNEKMDSKRFIQSTSVFSTGTGDVKLRMPPAIHHKERNSSSNLIKPTINRNNCWSSNTKNEDFLLDELNNCDLLDSDEEDEKSSFNALQLNNTATNKKIIQNIKEEPLEILPDPFNNLVKYDEDNPSLALLKLPDSFAGKGLSDDPNCKKLFDYPLKGMLEGQIGKLYIRKSGRMEVQIGKMRYYFESEVMNESKEQLATVVQGDNDSEMSLAFLGNITHNFVMYPDYEQF